VAIEQKVCFSLGKNVYLSSPHNQICDESGTFSIDVADDDLSQLACEEKNSFSSWSRRILVGRISTENNVTARRVRPSKVLDISNFNF